MRRGRAYAVDRMHVTPLDVDVPLSWADNSGVINLHATEVVATEKRNDDLPLLCFFTGGPGFEAARPDQRSGWLKEALERYRVILLDGRGTGQSAPLDGLALPQVGDLVPYLRNFRADSIVRDAEYLRRELIGDGRWTVMGHSFGGFCVLTYLSHHPEHLTAVINIGGFAPILRTADEVYGALADTIIERNRRHYHRYPEDAGDATRVVEHLTAAGQTDATGARILPQQFLAVGEWFGNQHGSAAVHSLIARAASDLDQLGRLSTAATARFVDVMRVTTNPIYAVLHEAIYAQYTATRWAASRVLATRPEFALDHTPPHFVGEMIQPWMFDRHHSLRPLHDAAHRLAEVDDWPPLYDVERLRANDVPVVGSIFWDDLYVHRDFALETAGIIGNCSPWLTNELEHRAPWEDPPRTMARLFAMLDEKVEPGP